MRELKFRAWVKDATTGEWRMCNRVRWLDLDNQRICTESGMQPDEFVLMQYTGLKDKNGREIYEGDFITAYNGRIKGPVIFDKRGLAFGIPNGPNEIYRFSMNFLESKDIEIIGNIYENPELLKESGR